MIRRVVSTDTATTPTHPSAALKKRAVSIDLTPRDLMSTKSNDSCPGLRSPAIFSNSNVSIGLRYTAFLLPQCHTMRIREPLNYESLRAKFRNALSSNETNFEIMLQAGDHNGPSLTVAYNVFQNAICSPETRLKQDTIF